MEPFLLLLWFSFLFGRKKRKIAQNRESNDDKQETDAVGETRRKTRSQIYHLDSGSQVVLEDIEMDFLSQPPLRSSSSSSCNSEPSEEPTVKSTSIQFNASHVKLDLDVMHTELPSHLTAPQGYMHHPVLLRRSQSLGELTTTHRSARLLSSDQLLRRVKSSPYNLGGDIFMQDYTQETPSREAKVSFVGLDLAETASQGYMDHPISTQRIRSLSEPTTTHKPAKLLSSDQLLRQVKSSPCSLNGDIMKDDAEETLSEEAKDIECQSNKEMLTGSKDCTASFSAPTTEHLETAPSSSFSVDSSTSPSNEDVLTSTHSKSFKSEESDSSADNSSKASFNEDADRSRLRRSFPFLFCVVLVFLLYLMIF